MPISLRNAPSLTSNETRFSSCVLLIQVLALLCKAANIRSVTFLYDNNLHSMAGSAVYCVLGALKAAAPAHLAGFLQKTAQNKSLRF